MKTNRLSFALSLALGLMFATLPIAISAAADDQVQPHETDVDDDSDDSDDSREVDVDQADDPSREADVDDDTDESN